jgi:hypothetical protein
LYVLVILGVVTLAGMGLSGLIRKSRAYRFWIIGVSLGLLIVELWIFAPVAPAANFNYREAPAAYSWLKDNSQVRAIAEYPLDEPPQGIYLSDYYTFQEISDKPMLNTLLPNSPQTPLRRSVVGINDPQTLPVLRSLGIDIVNSRPVSVDGHIMDISSSVSKNLGLDKLFSQNGRWRIDTFLIKPGPKASYALVIPTIQHSQILLTSDGGAHYVVGDDVALALVKLPDAVTMPIIDVAFDITSDSERKATIVQNGTVLWSGILSNHAQTIRLKVLPDHPLTIYNQRSTQPTQLVLEKLRAIE